jgi:hypothetical protein
MKMLAYELHCIFNELGINSTFDILQKFRSVSDTYSTCIPTNGMDKYKLPYLYRIPKFHKNPHKLRYIAGSIKCSTKPLSLDLLLTNISTAVREKLKTSCATTYAKNRVNQKWIPRNSLELLPKLKAQNVTHINSTIWNV